MLNSRPFIVEFSGTPEAGKTTTIGTVANMLRNKGYKVITLRESAEMLPEEIPKGTFEGNLWMHMITQSELLRASYSKSDIVLADRGIIDSYFYGWKFKKEKKCTKREYEEFKNTFLKRLVPDLLIALMVSPELSIKRRGGEGRLVNTEYVRSYNELFLDFYGKTKVQKELIITDKLDIYEMNTIIYDITLKYMK